MPNKTHLAFAFLLIAIVFLVYFDSFNNLFVYDDFPFLVDNPAVKNLNPKSVGSYFTDKDTISSSKDLAKDVWRPLVTLSFALDYKAWRLNAGLYHLENAILHSLDAILVYVLLFLVIGDGLAAFIGAVVFAIHPVQTSAVTWVSGRSNVLFLFFFLAALIAHIRNRQKGPSALYYGAGLIFFICALLSKEMAIILPAALILYDFYFYAGKKRSEYIGYYLPFFLITASYLAARFSVLGVIAQQTDWWGGSIFTSVLMTLKALAGYIKLLIIPVNLHAEYFVEIPKSLADRNLIMALVTLSLIAVLCWIFRRKKRASFWALWFFIMLLPVYNIVPFKAVMAERFLYLPVIGFGAIIGMIFSKAESDLRMNATLRALVIGGISVMLIVYGAISISRNIEWRDELSFYTYEALRSPTVAKAHYNLGYIYAKRADELSNTDKNEAVIYYSGAIAEFGKTAALKPDSQIAYFGLGNAYNALGLYDQAIKNLKKAVVLKENADVYSNLALAYYRKKMYDEAIVSAKQALKIDPHHLNAWINLGNAYYMKGRKADADAARKISARLTKEVK